jgi:hypothetical protein
MLLGIQYLDNMTLSCTTKCVLIKMVNNGVNGILVFVTVFVCTFFVDPSSKFE